MFLKGKKLIYGVFFPRKIVYFSIKVGMQRFVLPFCQGEILSSKPAAPGFNKT